jgi:hypothetical protein
MYFDVTEEKHMGSMRAFVRMRSLRDDTRGLARGRLDLERELKERPDVHEVAIVSILQRVMDLIGPPAEPHTETHKENGL